MDTDEMSRVQTLGLWHFDWTAYSVIFMGECISVFNRYGTVDCSAASSLFFKITF